MRDMLYRLAMQAKYERRERERLPLYAVEEMPVHHVDVRPHRQAVFEYDPELDNDDSQAWQDD